MASSVLQIIAAHAVNRLWVFSEVMRTPLCKVVGGARRPELLTSHRLRNYGGTAVVQQFFFVCFSHTLSRICGQNGFEADLRECFAVVRGNSVAADMRIVEFAQVFESSQNCSTTGN
jgi:hypothetical protein